MFDLFVLSTPMVPGVWLSTMSRLITTRLLRRRVLKSAYQEEKLAPSFPTATPPAAYRNLPMSDFWYTTPAINIFLSRSKPSSCHLLALVTWLVMNSLTS